MRNNKYLSLLLVFIMIIQLLFLSSCGGRYIREVSYKKYYTGDIDKNDITKVKVRVLRFSNYASIKAHAYMLESTIYFECMFNTLDMNEE